MASKIVRSVSDFNTELKLKGFNVFQIEKDGNATKMYSRKDFYKICLTTGKSKIHYADRSFEAKGTILFFGNPHVPYSWETISSKYAGYTCLFSEDFLKLSERSESLQQSPLFKIGGTPIFKITEKQRQFLNTLFEKMIEEQESGYANKAGLIRNYIHVILHEALNLQPSEQYDQHKNAASRIIQVFLELLERQFPVESMESPLSLKTPQDYASNLAIHVNHLNRSVKEIQANPHPRTFLNVLSRKPRPYLSYRLERDVVFDAFTNKASLEKWFAPHGCTFKYKLLEIKAGGKFHYCISNPEFGDCWCIGEYKEIVSRSKIVYTLINADENGNPIDPSSIGMDAEWPGETMVSITFSELEGKTKITLKQNVSESVAKKTGALPSWIEMLERCELAIRDSKI